MQGFYVVFFFLWRLMPKGQEEHSLESTRIYMHFLAKAITSLLLL